MQITKMRKLLVAVFGLGLLIANEYMGLPLPGDASSMADMTVSVLTAFGVWAVPNAA